MRTKLSTAASRAAQNFPAVVRSPAGDAERGRLRRELRGKRGVVHVDADAGDDGRLGKLDQNAGRLSAVQHDVVGPAQVARKVRGAGDGFRRGQAERQRQAGMSSAVSAGRSTIEQ